MSDTTKEHVTAEYYDEAGKLIWTEDPYLFKRMFGVDQEVYQPKPDGSSFGKKWYVTSNKFDGVFGNGKITYVVRDRWR